MISYAALLSLALLFNARDIRMLALSAMLGVGIFLPIPPVHFYLICALGEALIGLIAIRLVTPASLFIARVSLLLMAFHFMGWLLDGYPLSSPYHFLVRICEHAELLSCIALSKPILKRFDYA